MPREQLEDLLIDYFIGGLQSPETSPRVKVEKPKSITKAIDVAEIYENMLNNNTSMLTKTEYTTPSTYSIFESPSISTPSITQPNPRYLSLYLMPTGIRHQPTSRASTRREQSHSTYQTKENQQEYLNNTEVEYIPETGAAISVISEETAKKAGLNVYPYDKNKVRVITADGKEVQDVPGYVEADVTLGEHRLKDVKMLVFKRATNPCLIGRDVLAVHPSTKDHYQAMMGVTKPKLPNSLPLKHNHNVNNNADEADNTNIECKETITRTDCHTRLKSRTQSKEDANR